MIIPKYAEKAFQKTHLFLTKTLSKLGIKENFLNLLKVPMKILQPTVGVVNVFPLRSGTRQKYPVSAFLFNIVLEVLARAKMQEKEVNNIQLKRRHKIGFFHR